MTGVNLQDWYQGNRKEKARVARELQGVKMEAEQKNITDCYKITFLSPNKKRPSQKLTGAAESA
nr:hypothetical protein [uncultured Vibrio sp.]